MYMHLCWDLKRLMSVGGGGYNAVPLLAQYRYHSVWMVVLTISS